MRTSKEMADSVLKVRDAYEEENRKRKIKMKNTAGIAAVACSFCIMAGVLLFFKSKTPDDPGMPVAEVTVTETKPVSQNAPAIGTTEEYVVKEEQAIIVAETAVTEVSEVSSDVSAVTETEKTEKTEKTEQTEKKAETAKQNSSNNSSEQGKKNDSASVTEKVIETNKPEAQQTKPAVTEKKPEPVTEAKKEAVTEMIVTRLVKTEEVKKDDEFSSEEAPEKKSDASAEISKETPVPVATVRPTQSSQKITESAASVQPSMRPVAEAPEPVAAEKPVAAEEPVDESVKVNAPESASVPSAEATIITDRNIQAAFDEVIDYTVANNTDCYLYYKDNDQILVILCRNDEDVQKINALISEKGFDPSKFECRINDIVIDLPAQKTDDMEKQRKLISRFMTQNNIYGYAKIAEYEGEEKIIVMLNDTSSENAAKIRYFLSMYEISFNSVKIDSI